MWRQILRIPDFAELSRGWAELPRNGRLVGSAVLVLLLLLPALIGIGVWLAP